MKCFKKKEKTMTTNWMSDPAVADIDRSKLEFLQALVFESQSLSKEQMLPFLMSVAKKGSDKHISFTNAEVETIIEVIKKYSTPEEIKKTEKMVALFKKIESHK
jgi:predicted metalloprotease